MSETKKPKREETARDLIDSIKARLDSLEELLAWTIPAQSRFRKGSRVRISPMGRRRLMHSRRKGGVVTGRIVGEPRGPFIDVLLDGYKHPKGFHHMYWESV